MKQYKHLVIGLGLIAVVSLSGCAANASARGIEAGPANGNAEVYSISNRLQPGFGKENPGNPGKQQDDKGNNGKSKNGKGNGQSNENVGNGQPATSRGLSKWWSDFTTRLFGRPVATGGWQLGRFKDAFPFAYPAGWQVRDRGDALLLTGDWQNEQYLIQITRSVKLGSQSLEDWVTGDLQRPGRTAKDVRYTQADNVQVAVVTGVQDSEYSCPVAYVYLWTANPAGHNQRQAIGVISQAPASACDPAALNAFVDAYLAQLRGDNGPAPAATTVPDVSATAPAPTAAPTAAPSPAATDASGWVRSRFFNAFSFAYPQAWTMERLGDTAHLQGSYQGRSYVTDMVWVRDAPQVGLEQWARADLQRLGVSLAGMQIDYAPQGNDAQIAIVTGIRMPGYDCPLVRMYVVANNAAAGGQRSYTLTVAQSNGQSCEPGALEDVAYRMVQRAL